MNTIRIISVLLVAAAAASGQQALSNTIRICDDSGCSERSRDTATFDAAGPTDQQADQRLRMLTDIAKKDPRAAYDLGLRYFRGDGVRQNSYQALQWMRDAAERGDLTAQTAVGRFYLMGLEEMGSDPAEAEKWLSIAAGRGDKEAEKLLVDARAAKKSDIEYRRWIDLNRNYWYGYWASGYAYRGYWNTGSWYYR